jgi:hypothetical protein
MKRFELCRNTDVPGGGERHATLQDAKVAGWEGVGEVTGGPAMAALEDFFTVHELQADGATSVMVFDSRNVDPD